MAKTNHDECKHYGQNTEQCATFLASTKDRPNYKSIELVYTDTPGLYRQCDQQRMQHTHTQPFHGPLSRTTRVSRYQKKHSPTHTHLIIGHPLSTSSIYYDPCSVYVLDSPFPQPLSRSSLVFLLNRKTCKKTN